MEPTPIQRLAIERLKQHSVRAVPYGDDKIVLRGPKGLVVLPAAPVAKIVKH
jgi:hypothetical protein